VWQRIVSQSYDNIAILAIYWYKAEKVNPAPPKGSGKCSGKGNAARQPASEAKCTAGASWKRARVYISLFRDNSVMTQKLATWMRRNSLLHKIQSSSLYTHPQETVYSGRSNGASEAGFSCAVAALEQRIATVGVFSEQ